MGDARRAWLIAGAALGCGASSEVTGSQPKSSAGKADVARPAGQPAASAPVAAPIARDSRCAEFFVDADFLESVFAEVTDRGYRPTKKSCAAYGRQLDQRFPYGFDHGSPPDERSGPAEAPLPDWRRKHGIPSMSEAGEPRATTAARVLVMTCLPIVKDFACGFEPDLVKEFGRETIAADFDRDFRRYVGELRAACE